MRFLRFLLLPLCSLSLAGCAGYTLGPIKPTIYKGIETVAVPSFKNDTLQPRVEVLLANSLIKQLQQNGTYKVVSEKDAYAIIACTLDQIIHRPSRSVSGNVLQTREFTLTLRVIYRVVDRKTGKEIDRRAVVGTTSYFVSGSS